MRRAYAQRPGRYTWKGNQSFESWQRDFGLPETVSVRGLPAARWETSLGLPVHRLNGRQARGVWLPTLRNWTVRWRRSCIKLNSNPKHRGLLNRLRKILLLAFAASASSFLAVRSVIVARWHRLSPRSASISPPISPSLAIVQFENSTGDDRLEPWRTALPDLMITDLVQSRFITVVRITDL